MRRRWTPEWENIDAATDWLDLWGPVEIVPLDRDARVGGYVVDGYHKLTARGHEIGVGAHLDEADASRTIWHELAHARQAEDHPRPSEYAAHVSARAELVQVGLLGDPELPLDQRLREAVPEEAEACAHEELHHCLPLTRRRSLLYWRNA